MTNVDKPEMKNLKILITKYPSKPSIKDNAPIKILPNKNGPTQNTQKNSYASANPTQLKTNREKESSKVELNNFNSNRSVNEMILDKLDKRPTKQYIQFTNDTIKKKNSGYFEKSQTKQKEILKSNLSNTNSINENSYTTVNNPITITNNLSKIFPNKHDLSNLSVNEKSQNGLSRKNSNSNANSQKDPNLNKKNYSTNPINVKKSLNKIKQIPMPTSNLNSNYNSNANSSISRINSNTNTNANSLIKNEINLKSSDLEISTTVRIKDDNPSLNIISYLKNTKSMRNKTRTDLNEESFLRTNRESTNLELNSKNNLNKAINGEENCNSKASIPVVNEDRGMIDEFITATNEKTNAQKININISPIIRKKPKPKIPKIKINKIHPHTIYKITEFMQSDITSIYKTSRELNNLIKEQFKFLSQNIIDDFEITYKDSFEIVSKSLILEENKSKKLSVNILIQARLKLPESMYGNNLTITDLVKYVGDKYFYKNMYKFDYRSPETPCTTWIMGEHSKLQSNDFNTAMVQPILNFTQNDVFNISITLLSPRGMIDVTSHKWMKLIHIPIPKLDFINFNEGHRYREIAELNLSRFCELELTKNKWIDVSLSKEESVSKYAKNIQNLLYPMFLVNKMQYDDLGIFYFKIYAVAIKSGIYNADSQISTNLVVKESKKFIKNEIKKNGLIFDRSNYLELRIGDVIVFFFCVSKDFLQSIILV